MATLDNSLTCYVATLVRDPRDTYLKSRGLTADLAIFAIPAYGILFKSLVDGALVDLEFGSFFALLRYITTSLESEKISRVEVLSSNPEFVLAFTGQLPHLVESKERKKLLTEFSQKLKISVGLVESFRNQAYLPLPSFPSVPRDKVEGIKLGRAGASKPEFKRLQRGIKL